MWTAPLRALLVQIVLLAIAAVFARRAKPAALVLGAAAFFGAPWLAGPIPLLRAFSALFAFVGLLRVIDVVRFREPWSAWRRLLHVASFVDSRTLRRAPPRLDSRAFGRALLWAGIAGVGLVVAHSPRQIIRWAGGLVLAYAAVEWLYAFTTAAFRAVGIAVPRLHVLPLASLSLGELWGVRWARPVSGWLRETCLRPLARRGHSMLGLLLGFFVSAIGHGYPVFVAIGLPMAAWMFAFFVGQGVLVLIEARLGVARWSRPARRAWTVTLMIATSPLFVEPGLRLLGCP